MLRALFEKKGNAVWISHLDLMRLFQRAFKRSGLALKHTQGFNPRPSVSIALPMSVGVESACELLDFELDGETPSCAELVRLLNKGLIEGVRVLNVYENGRKIRDLALLACSISMEYDGPIPEDCCTRIQQLFACETLVVSKKSKNGPQDQDLIPMIRRLTVCREPENKIRIEGVICCQNPTLNPAQIPAAISKYLPDLTPDHVLCRRLEIFDTKEEIFR